MIDRQTFKQKEIDILSCNGLFIINSRNSDLFPIEHINYPAKEKRGLTPLWIAVSIGWALMQCDEKQLWVTEGLGVIG